MNIAQKCREEKQAHPERFCPKCLWNVERSGPCRNHGTPKVVVEACCWCDRPILPSEPVFTLPDGSKCHDTAWCRGELNAYTVDQGREEEEA